MSQHSKDRTHEATGSLLLDAYGIRVSTQAVCWKGRVLPLHQILSAQEELPTTTLLAIVSLALFSLGIAACVAGARALRLEGMEPRSLLVFVVGSVALGGGVYAARRIQRLATCSLVVLHTSSGRVVLYDGPTVDPQTKTRIPGAVLQAIETAKRDASDTTTHT